MRTEIDTRLDVSIIIVNYNTADLIKECIDSIRKHTSEIRYEIIIVDNGNELLNSLESKEVRIISLNNNLGFGRANNEGFKIAKGRNIFFLNPDTKLLNNAVKILSNFLDHHKEAGACGGNLYNSQIQPAYSFKRLFPGVKWEINELLNHIPQRIAFGSNYCFNQSQNPLTVACLSGACIMVKKEVFEETGGFGKEFFMYFEDTDLCKRISLHGWKIYNVPSAKIQHLESGSFKEFDNAKLEQKTQYLEKGRKIYYSKNHNKIYTRISDIIYNIFLTSRIILLRGGIKKDYYKIRKKYFKNVD